MSIASAQKIQDRRASDRSRERWGRTILALALLMAAGLAARRWAFLADASPPPGVGSTAPGFREVGLNGDPVALEDFRGQVVLVDFWATWCPPCVAALPELDRLHRAYRDQGFTVLGVNQEPGDEARVRAFVTGRSLPFPVVVDSGGAARAYGVHSLPTSFLLDREGTVRAMFRGVVSEPRLHREVRALVEGPLEHP